MKIVLRILSLAVLASLSVFYIACDKGDGGDESVQSIQFKKLKGSWGVTSVTLDNGPRQDFQGVVLGLATSSTFAENATYPYTITGTLPNPSPWPKSGGTWKFGTDPESDIIRDPADTGANAEIAVDYQISEDGNTLIMSFNVPDGGGFQGGKVEAVTGEWVFTFTKQ